MRRELGIGVTVFIAIGLVLMFMLAQATNNQTLYERNYLHLFIINVVVAALLMLMIGWMSVRLLLRLRQGKFGSRLLIRLAAIFALVGVVPGVLIYVVSYQFVSRSIESWFDVKVEGALDAGLNLARATLDSFSQETSAKVLAASAQLGDVPDVSAGLTLERIREQVGASDVVLWNGNGHLIASAGASRFRFDLQRPSARRLHQVRTEHFVTDLEGLDDSPFPGIAPVSAGVRVLLLVRQPNFGLSPEQRFLEVIIPIPAAIAANALAVQDANREYQERSLARRGLLRMYLGTLTLSLILAVFSAVLLAVLFGNRIARPLLVLADGVRQVAAGDLRPKAVLPGKDELDGLTRSFAVMTDQLAEARASVEKTVGQLDAARTNLQTILDNLTSGVIVLDPAGRMLSANPSATRVLRAPLAAYEGQSLAQVPGLKEFSDNVQQQFADLEAEHIPQGVDHWQNAFMLQPANGSASVAAENVINLLARGAQLPGATRLLVFDDISEIVSAQRAQAWGEVARRLAHEIKNPLTPIQLSAERLNLKLAGKLQPSEQAVLTKSVKTIVDQVEAMKRLVNEFRDYARLPAAQLKPVNLNTLIGDVLHMYEAGNTTAIRVQADLDPCCPPILGDTQQLRQVLHNLLQNAQDATEGAGASMPQEPVVIRTRSSDSGRRVRLTVQDSGHGFAEHILKRAFEPYVTTKSKGTGLGLAMVKKIADEHGARIELSNRRHNGVVAGAKVSLSFALAQVSQPTASTTTTTIPEEGTSSIA
jgi:nitrogen fixation/metabolism regulation signal transduction histidine kinase